MKKVLTLILVLGMASAASAALQISVHTNPPGGETWNPLDPQPTDITINVSDELILDIYTTTMIYAGAIGEGDWFLMCDTNLGSISGGVANAALVATGNVLAIYDGKATGAWQIDDPFDGVGGAVVVLGAPIMAGDTLYDNILFHCGALGDTVITLVQGQAIVSTQGDPYFEVTGTYDSVVIHQIPEPMTMALLGLGGLALIRRRK